MSSIKDIGVYFGATVGFWGQVMVRTRGGLSVSSTQ